MSSMSFDIRPHKKLPILSSNNIYDTTEYENANTTQQRSSSTSDAFCGRSMRPRITEDKISKSCFCLI